MVSMPAQALIDQVQRAAAEAWEEGYFQGRNDESDHEYGHDHDHGRGCAPLEKDENGALLMLRPCSPNPYKKEEENGTV